MNVLPFLARRTLLAVFVACCACSSPEREAERDGGVALSSLALAFDGDDDYATLGTASFPFAEAQQTVSLWLALDSAPMEARAIVAVRADFVSGFVLGVRDGLLEVWSAYSGRSYVRAVEALPSSEWHHVAYVFDGAQHALYVDGVLQARGDYPPNNRTPTSAWLGSTDGRSGFFHGRLDQLKLWGAARTAQEVASEAGGAIVGDRSTLIASLAFDEVEGTRALDESGLGNHATLGDGDAERSPVRVPSPVSSRPPP